MDNEVAVNRDRGRDGWSGYELIGEIPVQRAAAGVSLVTSWRLRTRSHPSS